MMFRPGLDVNRLQRRGASTEMECRNQQSPSDTVLSMFLHCSNEMHSGRAFKSPLALLHNNHGSQLNSERIAYNNLAITTTSRAGGFMGGGVSLESPRAQQFAESSNTF